MEKQLLFSEELSEPPMEKGNFYCQGIMNDVNQGKGQLKNLHKSPEDLRTNKGIIQLELKEGIMGLVPDTPDRRHVRYIPHRP